MADKDHSMIYAGIVFAVLWWFGEAVFHLLVFTHGTFLENLVPADRHELWMRSFTTVLILGFGCYSHMLFNRLINYNREISETQKQLEEALANTLSEFIPICSSCRKIRLEGADSKDPEGWVSIESYVHRETASTFSHGICPDCKQALYGDLLAKT